MSAAGHQTINLQAGVPFVLGSGNFFQILTQSGTDKIKVIFSRNSSQLLDSVDAASAGFFAKPKPDLKSGQVGQDTSFDSVILTSATAQTLEVLVLAGEAGSNIFSGSVSVTGVAEVKKSLSTVDDAFSLIHKMSGASYPRVQIYNPSNSGKVIYLYKASVTYHAAVIAGLGVEYIKTLNAAQLATTPTFEVVPNLTGGVSVAEIRHLGGVASDSLSASDKKSVGVQYGSGVVQADPYKFEPCEPLVIEEGEGLMIYLNQSSSVGTQANFYFREVAA